MSRKSDFAGSALPCPDCGTAGKPDGSSKGILSHEETPGHCRTYTWNNAGRVIARDVHTKAERDANAETFDARIRSLNPFTRNR